MFDWDDDLSISLKILDVDNILDDPVRPKYESNYRIPQLRWMKHTARDVIVSSKFFSDKFLIFLNKNNIKTKGRTPRKFRPLKQPKVVVSSRSPKEKLKPSVPRFAHPVKKIT